MVALDIWYDGEDTIRVTTADELDALIDRILAETRDNAAPPMIQVAVAGQRRSPALEVGLGPERGFIGFTSRTEAGWTRGDQRGSDAMVDYVYMGNHSQVPAHAEVSIGVVRAGLREFLETGGRPSVIAVAG